MVIFNSYVKLPEGKSTNSFLGMFNSYVENYLKLNGVKLIWVVAKCGSKNLITAFYIKSAISWVYPQISHKLRCWIVGYIPPNPQLCVYIYIYMCVYPMKSPIVDGKTSRKPRQLPDPSPLRSHGPSAPSVMLAATADACPSQEIMKS